MLDEALRRIQEAKRTKQTVLDLSDLDLTELPEEICELTWLTELDLRDNRLTSLPESIGALTALTKLDLYENRLRALPDSFGHLRSLRVLDLDNSWLTVLPESFGELIALAELDISRNDLEAIPDSIGNLTALTELILHGNDLRALPESIGRLANLRVLELHGNDLKALPETLGNLVGLTELTINSNRLASLPESIGNLTKLSRLNLSENRLTELPETIQDLTELTALDLTGNRLVALPEGIGRLTALTSLLLRDNDLRSLPDSIGKLTLLTSLTFWDNDIEALPDSIGDLTDLTEFDPSFNRLASLPESIGNLTELTSLDLSNNRLASLPESIGNLTRLTRLHLNYNRLTRLPESIGALFALATLDLNGNELPALTDTIGNLTSLTTLQLDGNTLRSLPESIAALPRLTKFSAERNPLPPEMAAAQSSHVDGLMTFLKEVASDGVAVREAKLVLVGEGAVGKSTLLSAMLGEPFEADRSSTHGIEVRPLTLSQGTPDECVLNTWDFGGQETYRPTHQLFFTAPAVYLVVWKPRHGPRQDNVEEWIDLIRRRAGDDIRIHVVATHGGPKDRFAHIDEMRLRQAHGDVIVDFHHVDSSTGAGIEDLKAAVQRTAAGLPYFSRKLPGSWRRFQDGLRQAPEPYLEYHDYLVRAAEHGLSEASAKTLATVATDLGHWCYYPDIPGLDQLVVLKGDWLSAAVSLVIDDPETVRNHGLVEHSRLKHIWNDPANPPHLRYPEKVHRVLLRLMEEYEISYRVGGGGHGGRPPTSLIAQLVDPRTPALGEWEDHGRDLPVQTRICKFSDASGNFHIPEGLIYRLIVRLHQFSLGREQYEQSLHWTNGLVIDHGLHGRALIRLERKQLTVSVKAVAPEYFLTMILEEVRSHVAEFWQGVKVHNFVTCGGFCNDPDATGQGQWEVERLFNRRMKGKPEITCTSCDEDVSIRALLSGVAEPAAPNDRLAEVFERVLDSDFVGRSELIWRLAASDRREEHLEASMMLSRNESDFQTMLKALADEAPAGPRILNLESLPGRRDAASVRFNVLLWCEYSRKPLWQLNSDQNSGVVPVEIPKEWIERSGRWVGAMGILLESVHSLAPGDAAVQPVIQQAPPFRRGAVRNALRVMRPYTEYHEVEMRAGDSVADQLRELHRLIREKDPTFGGLVRVRTRSGYLWVHPQFEAELNPGLPNMGEE
ncbi:leucine-rich repeat domain-containing protein [Glycomyces dulcitolivorans]|uniref:leucine-rich repeat domain-containing protein n=1 Tax=Glycomyces dulcitolivorans TaxID=2200759 RepID=UPI000DD32F67|nr:COR domain-containing protein [Glycomyces dulcitolivorans]